MRLMAELYCDNVKKECTTLRVARLVWLGGTLARLGFGFGSVRDTVTTHLTEEQQSQPLVLTPYKW